jgi:hypothetical protein
VDSIPDVVIDFFFNSASLFSRAVDLRFTQLQTEMCTRKYFRNQTIGTIGQAHTVNYKLRICKIEGQKINVEYSSK